MVINGFYDGESLNECMKKYKIDDDEDNIGSKFVEFFFKDEVERLKYLYKICVFFISLVVFRIFKNRICSYEVIGF